jgi:DnaJ-class molecular chaperone
MNSVSRVLYPTVFSVIRKKAQASNECVSCGGSGQNSDGSTCGTCGGTGRYC